MAASNVDNMNQKASETSSSIAAAGRMCPCLPAIGDFPLELARHGYQIMVIDVFRGQPWVDNGKEEYETWRARHPVERVDQDIKCNPLCA